MKIEEKSSTGMATGIFLTFKSDEMNTTTVGECNRGTGPGTAAPSGQGWEVHVDLKCKIMRHTGRHELQLE